MLLIMCTLIQQFFLLILTFNDIIQGNLQTLACYSCEKV